jgi:hypothetical protein
LRSGSAILGTGAFLVWPTESGRTAKIEAVAILEADWQFDEQMLATRAGPGQRDRGGWCASASREKAELLP